MTDLANDPYARLKVFSKVLIVTVNLNQVYGVAVETNPFYIAIGDSHKDAYPTIVPVHSISQIITDPKLLERENNGNRSAN